MDLIADLEFRGLIYQVTDLEGLRERLSKGRIVLYVGFDPTADSLHVGHLLPILGLRRFQLAGHIPIALVGGGTGLIGDPSGKTTERTLNPQEVVEAWSQKIRSQLERFLDFEVTSNPARIANNFEWLGELKMIPFLRDIGKHFSLGYMLSKESVKSRLESGISFTEFCYMLLQAYDFLQLAQRYNCELQAGGSDQWGNITAGMDLIQKVLGKKVYGLTFPLVTRSDGTKFGKTEQGAVWLDPERTTPYQFYQFWLNVDDRDVVTYLKYFTFLSREEILELEEEVKRNPERREAQRVLAREMTALVHGKEALERAEKISRALFYGQLEELTPSELEEAFRDVPSCEITGREGIGIVDLLVFCGAASSKREAREHLKNGAIQINGVKIQEIDRTFRRQDCLGGKYLVIKRGKKNYYLAKWLS
ncbi:MAG: tyrosyl-tRNA synthetase [Candidatus Atribacteria bacterium]|nr:tyrosyl-tRNA synthetase [Candidatus Atribacteria bacterium]MDI3530318.1 tyrosyl-tRNA synthetase [Candidatus Atribacteria bacterium]